jgi:hypothetical protein
MGNRPRWVDWSYLLFCFKVICDSYIKIFENLVFAAMWRREQIHRKSWCSCHRLLWNKKRTSPLDWTWSFTRRVRHLRAIEDHLSVFRGLRKMRIALNIASYRAIVLKFKIKCEKQSESCRHNVQWALRVRLWALNIIFIFNTDPHVCTLITTQPHPHTGDFTRNQWVPFSFSNFVSWSIVSWVSWICLVPCCLYIMHYIFNRKQDSESFSGVLNPLNSDKSQKTRSAAFFTNTTFL